MSLIAVTRTGNEADLIEAFVQHHAAICDWLLIIEDNSTDGTLQILERMIADGFPIRLYHASEISWTSDDFATRLMHIAATDYDAEWIAPLDVDEFLEFPKDWSPRDRLRQNEVVQLKWSNFAWDRSFETSAERNPVKRQTLRMGPRRDSSKVFVPGAMVRADPSCRLTVGNHGFATSVAGGSIRNVDGLALCHYPIRSVAQFAAKVARMHLRYTSLPPNEHLPFQYSTPYKMLSGDMSNFIDLMERESRAYAVWKGGGVEAAPSIQPLEYLGSSIKWPNSPISLTTLLSDEAELLAKKISHLQAELQRISR